ncbi:MAG: hypothetical protein JXK05_01275 [Campylobacterales bacterium]|nr:hypothetical protein [Campylobacterales bacterium]
MKTIGSILIGVLSIAGAYYLYDSRTAQADIEQKQTQVTYHQTLCPSGTSDAGYSIHNKPVCELSNIITNDLHLSADRYWQLRGEVLVGGDNSYQSTLSIEPGATIFGTGGGDFLVINRGSKILARGTQIAPIVFTSESELKGLKPNPGDWGGLVIAGNAPINTGTLDQPFEFSGRNIRFGGDNPEDDSGVLKYVVIKYGGDEVARNKEINGLSLGGVGRGTLIDYVEVYKGKDDGIEVWGGTVNMKHVVLIGNRDDALDTDLGYQGNIQYLYAETLSLSASQSGNGIESDNNVDNHAAAPRTRPTLANFTLVGAYGSDNGILLRSGSGFSLINGVIMNFERAQLAIRDRATLDADAIFFQSVALGSGEEEGNLYGARDGIEKEEVKKRFESGKLCSVDAFDTTPSSLQNSQGGFFDEAAFVGSHRKEQDWRSGWTVGL